MGGIGKCWELRPQFSILVALESSKLVSLKSRSLIESTSKLVSLESSKLITLKASKLVTLESTFSTELCLVKASFAKVIRIVEVSRLADLRRRCSASFVRNVSALILEPKGVGVGYLGVSACADGLAGDEAEVGTGLIRAARINFFQIRFALLGFFSFVASTNISK